MKPEEQTEDGEHRERFDKLRRVEEDVAVVGAVHWDAGVFVSGLGEVDTPPPIRRLAPTAARGEAALAAKRLAKCDRGSERVRHLPEVELILPHQQGDGYKTADQAAVEYSARTKEIYGEDLGIRVDEEHQDL